MIGLRTANQNDNNENNNNKKNKEKQGTRRLCVFALSFDYIGSKNCLCNLYLARLI